jgi:hypothetical protein
MNLRYVMDFAGVFYVVDTVSCIVYSESPGYFEINKERDIVTE